MPYAPLNSEYQHVLTTVEIRKLMAESYAQKNGIYPTLPRDEPDNRDPNGINKHLQVRQMIHIYHILLYFL